MDETIVVKESLSSEMVEDGAQLLQKLDEMGLPISLAMWFYISGINEWRLMFASPESSVTGSTKVYEKINEARRAIGDLSERLPLLAIGVMGSSHPLVQLFRTAVKTGPGISRVRFSRSAVNGHFIDDALIYRIAS